MAIYTLELQAAHPYRAMEMVANQIEDAVKVSPNVLRPDSSLHCSREGVKSSSADP